MINTCYLWPNLRFYGVRKMEISLNTKSIIILILLVLIIIYLCISSSKDNHHLKAIKYILNKGNRIIVDGDLVLD